MGGDVEEEVGLGPGGASTGKASLRLVATSQETEVHVTRVRVAGGETEERPAISGVIQSVDIGTENALWIHSFYVANFRNYNGSAVRDESSTCTWNGRVVVEANGWRVTLDKVQPETATLEELRNVGGYAITHVGKLERADAGVFTLEQEQFRLANAATRKDANWVRVADLSGR